MPSLVVIGPQIKEKQRRHNVPSPAYMVPKDPSLHRVNDLLIFIHSSQYVQLAYQFM